MAKIATAYADNSGKLHPNAHAAVLADLTALLGRVGGDGGMAPALAQMLLERREEIKQSFADFEALGMDDSQ